MKRLAFAGLSGLGFVLGGCSVVLGLGDFTEGPAPGAGGATSSSGSNPSSTTTSSGAGGAMVCQPLSQTNCYDADPATIQGACHPGKKTCKEDGSGYGDCTGEVTPRMADDCATMTDADCDGKLTCSCTPGATMPCYDGAPGTDAHLPCKGGTRTCEPDGAGYAACAGEVTPLAMDDCTTPADDNCDGVVNDFCVCKAGQTQPCYDGAPSTKDVGNCKAGAQSCNGDGTGWNACKGEVVPTKEQCDVHGDEDCDGVSCSELVWADMFSIGSNQVVTFDSIVVDPAGNTFVSVDYEGGVDFGNGVAVAGQSGQVFAKIDPAGKAVWVQQGFGGKLALDKQGNLYIGNGGVVKSFTPVGAPRWTKSIAPASVASIVIDSTGQVIIAGDFAGTLTLGDATNPATSQSIDGYVAKLGSANGFAYWLQVLGDAPGKGASAQQISGIACDSGSNVLVTGVFQTSLAVGPQTFTPIGSADIFVAKLNGVANGSPIWGAAFGSPNSDLSQGIAVDAVGEPVIVGQVGGSLTFGGGNLINQGSSDAFVLKLGVGGAFQWAKLFGGTATDSATSVSIDAADNVVLTGLVYGSENLGFGGPPVATNGGPFLAKLDPIGNPLWSKVFGDGAQDQAHVRTLPGGGDVFLELYSYGTTDLGSGPLTNGGNDSILLGRFQP